MAAMKIASPEIRRFVVEAYQAGKATKKQLADIFGFHPTAVDRWIRITNQEGRYTTFARGHKKPAFSQQEREQLIALLQDRPDITLTEIREHFSKKCSLTSVFRTVKALGFRCQKTSGSQRVRAKDYHQAAQDAICNSNL